MILVVISSLSSILGQFEIMSLLAESDSKLVVFSSYPEFLNSEHFKPATCCNTCQRVPNGGGLLSLDIHGVFQPEITSLALPQLLERVFRAGPHWTGGTPKVWVTGTGFSSIELLFQAVMTRFGMQIHPPLDKTVRKANTHC